MLISPDMLISHDQWPPGKPDEQPSEMRAKGRLAGGCDPVLSHVPNRRTVHSDTFHLSHPSGPQGGGS